jgi:hypothetical protein
MGREVGDKEEFLVVLCGVGLVYGVLTAVGTESTVYGVLTANFFRTVNERLENLIKFECNEEPGHAL